VREAHVLNLGAGPALASNTGIAWRSCRRGRRSGATARVAAGAEHAYWLCAPTWCPPRSGAYAASRNQQRIPRNHQQSFA